MAERPAVKTKQIGRDKLARFLPDLELIKRFENLVSDVSEVLPDAAFQDAEAIEAAQLAAEQASDDAAVATSAAATAQAAANAAQSDADAALLAISGVAGDTSALSEPQYVVTSTSPAIPNARLLSGDILSIKVTNTSGFSTISRADLVSVLASDVSDATAALVDSGLTLALSANATYLVEGFITFQTAATTTGIALAFTAPAGSTVVGAWQHNTTATASEGSYGISSGTTKGATSGALATGEFVPVTGSWLIKTAGTSGAANLQFRSEVAASAVTLKAGVCLLFARRIV